MFYGLGFSLLYFFLYAGIPDAFLAKVGTAQALFNLYMGLLGGFLLVQTRRQQLELKALPS